MKKTTKTPKKEIDKTRVCRNCEHHYDEHEKGADGRFFVARCKFKKWCVLMDYLPDACSNFSRIKQTQV